MTSDKNPSSRTSLFNRVIFFFNYIFVTCLLLSYLAPFVSAESFTTIAFLGLAYPALVLANLLFVIYWLLLWKKRFLLSFVGILAGWFILSNYWSFNFKAATDISTHRIKLMSYNVRLFDLYNRPFNIGTRNKMFELIKDEAPDIICMQEFYKDDSKKFNTLDTLLEFQQAKNYHVVYTTTVLEKHHFGIATFTTYPIVNKGNVSFESDANNACIYTDLKINADTIRIYNLHLQSIHLSNVVYADLKTKFETKEVFEKETKNIVKRLAAAFSRRSSQADLIAAHIKTCKYPVIVCGDFNDTPSSYAYHTLKGNLTDAFKESGIGFGATYAGDIPLLRIDYILHSNQVESTEFNIIPEKLSDHYPITCTIKLTSK